MPLVSAAQITALRNVAYKQLDTPVTISRATQTEGDYGSVEVWSEVASAMGWLREMSTTKAGDQITFVGTTGTFRLHLQHDVDIRPGDRVSAMGDDFTVSDVNNDNTIRIFSTAIMRRVE